MGKHHDRRRPVTLQVPRHPQDRADDGAVRALVADDAGARQRLRIDAGEAEPGQPLGRALGQVVRPVIERRAARRMREQQARPIRREGRQRREIIADPALRQWQPPDRAGCERIRINFVTAIDIGGGERDAAVGREGASLLGPVAGTDRRASAGRQVEQHGLTQACGILASQRHGLAVGRQCGGRFIRLG